MRRIPRGRAAIAATSGTGPALTVTGMAILGLAAGVVGPATPAYAAAGAAAPGAGVTQSSRFTGPSTGVIVRYDGRAAAQRAVEAVGGTVGEALDLIGAFTAQVPRDAIGALRSAAGVAAVTPNADVRFSGADAREWAADEDVSSLHSITRSAGAQAAWADGITGEGVGVALIDSGVVPVQGLDGPGKVVNGPDLSFESQAENLRYLDTFGHGTHLAGIIAGRDSDTPADPASFTGVAPGAHLVSLKVAAADGATDVSQVIAAIDWVVTHRNDPGLNIRVLNLAFGTDSVQDARLDPLSYAVDAAWRHGIVVVVAVGNGGADQKRVDMPAANQRVLAVGATDPNGTATRADDTVAEFSTAGNARRHADLLAAGKSVVSLRNPGSYADTNHPEGLVTGDSTTRFFRGSGTSQATAVVAGAAALLLDQRPELTPDQVKKLLTGSAAPLQATAGHTFGAGQLDVGGALATPTPAGYRQHVPAATGLGSLEAARGSAHVADADTGEVLTGERDIFGQPWNPQVWASAADQGTAWNGGDWNGTTWTGADWNGTSWAGRTWSGRTWSGRTWSGRTWSGRTWSDAVWSGRTWSGRTWSGRTWSGRTWSGRTWSGRTWSGDSWLARTWSARTWS